MFAPSSFMSSYDAMAYTIAYFYSLIRLSFIIYDTWRLESAIADKASNYL